MSSASKRFRELLALEWQSNPFRSQFREISLPQLLPPKTKRPWSFLLPDPRFSTLGEMREVWRDQKKEDYWTEVTTLSQWLCNLSLPEDWVIWQSPEALVSNKRYRNRCGQIDFDSQPLIAFTLMHFSVLDEFDGCRLVTCGETGAIWESELFGVLARCYGFTEIEPIYTQGDGCKIYHGLSGFPPNGLMAQPLVLSSVLARLEQISPVGR